MRLHFLLVAVLFAASPALAAERIVSCSITGQPGNKVLHEGKCKFYPEGNGSFSLTHPVKDKYLFDRTLSFTVLVTDKDEGDTFASMADKGGGGHNSRWCEVRRSPTDKACWVGECVRVCAW